MEKQCNHKDGWVYHGIIVLGEENIIEEFECNTLDCEKRKRFKFDITNVEPQE